MNYQLPVEGKKNRSSFWGKLFGTSKKCNSKERKDGDSFQRQSSLYHSFHFTSAPHESNESQEEGCNFTTLESSALMDIHKDSGILFLNKDSIANCMMPKEEDKHVQFAPTPMNKYYRVDVKAAPTSRSKFEENKENLKLGKPSRPILRRSKENIESLSDHSSDTNKVKVSVSYIDGPEVKKTPIIPRTSTKLALFDRKNGSLPHLNVSGIAKYGSLPRTAREKFLSENADRSSNVSNKLFFPPTESNQPTYNNIPQQEFHNVYPRSEVTNRFSIPDLTRHVDQNHLGRQSHVAPNQVRLSTREPFHPEMNSFNVVVCYDPNCGVVKNNPHAKQQINSAVMEADRAAKRGNRRHDFLAPGQMSRETSANFSTKAKNYQFPNKAINEVGLPTPKLNVSERCPVTKHRSRSESPHYIPLSETYSFDKAARMKKSEASNKNPQQNYSTGNFRIPAIPKSQNNIPVLRSLENRNQGEENHFLSQARRQAIRSSMYIQRKKFTNKLCKYKSKECEDGFSSMADDECSFNCSCSSCVAKFSRQYKRNMNRNSLGLLDNDKSFFTRDQEIKEVRSLPPVPEIVSAEDGPKSGTNEAENLTGQALSTTWYQCDDSLCKTPVKDNLVAKEKTEQNETDEKIIYENITQMINSATKQNFKPQEVERMFSTPISTARFKKELEKSISGKKIARALFPPDDNPGKRQKHALSPAKSPIVFSDSVILLQEIFQKLSQECKELLQPDVSSAVSQDAKASDKYVNNLVKNLRSKEISEGDFASIIGGIAQNIFLEAKLKNKSSFVTQAKSLPDLTKDALPTDPKLKTVSSWEDMTSVSNKVEDACNTASDSGFRDETVELTKENSCLVDGTLAGKHLPDGWSKTPTTVSDASNQSATEKSTSEKENSRSSESEMQLLEEVIRLGMGLSPVGKVEKTTTLYSSSPVKASKFKSKDVLSCKGKLKLKIYHNSGLVTVHVIRAAKLNRLNGRDLNPYIKISMVPDNSKRVHWRTSVQKAQKNPVFNQKFSFELVAEDSTKRLVFSVWHRDFVKERSELIGCMSFSIRHVLDDTQKIDGWYRLLREGFGTQKHFAAHARKNQCAAKHVK